MRFYFPKSRSQFYRTNPYYHTFGKLWVRKYKRKNYWNLFYALWFWIFLEFAVKIGSIGPMIFTDLKNLRIIQLSAQIKLPGAHNAEKLYSIRHFIFITIDDKGNYELDGKPIKFGRLQQIFNNNETNDDSQDQTFNDEYDYSIPNLWYKYHIIALIIDKNCEMQYVQKLLKVLRKNKFYRVVFITRKIRG